MCTSASIPEISMTATEASFRNFNFFTSGETAAYSPLNITFLVDEEMQAYKQLFSWLLHNQRNDNLRIYDLSLHLLSNRYGINQTIEFKDAFISSIGSVDFTNSEKSNSPITCNATFEYSRFEFL
jgi:hypothetical protein